MKKKEVVLLIDYSAPACVNAIGMEKKTSRLIDRDGQNQSQYVESIKIMI